MKNAKLLKSAVLSTALLFVGGAQAQTSENSATSITLQVAASIAVTAGDLSFGTFPPPPIGNVVTLSCGSGGTPTLSSVPTTIGNCGNVGVTTSSGTDVTYRVGVTATALTSGANSAATSVMTVYSATGTVVAAADNQTVSSSDAGVFYVGGRIHLGGGQAVGTYTGTYTFTATIQ